MKRIGILLVATNRYREFVPALLEGIDKNFLRNHHIDVHIFTNERFDMQWHNRLWIDQHTIPAYKFPEATLLRYKIFHDNRAHLSGYDWLFYLDVDMAIEQEVGDELLQKDLVAVRHPGFYAEGRGWGSTGNDPRSKSYIGPEYQKKYFCGGIQGGQAGPYLAVCEHLHYLIEEDLSIGVMPVYHDETMWNYFLNYGITQHAPNFEINELTPSYCSVPSMEQRANWGIDHLPAKIIALDKNHNYYRS